VTTGTYALCRHPGVLWLTLFLAALAAATASRDLAVATPIWIAADVIHVVRQEKRYLIPLFGAQYVAYQTQSPSWCQRLDPSDAPSARKTQRRSAWKQRR